MGYGWLSTKSEWIGEVELEIGLPPGEAYIWNCVTLARHRRKGVFRSVVNSIVGQAHKEGLTRLWIASIVGIGGKTIQQAGFEPVLRFDASKMLGLHWLQGAAGGGSRSGPAGVRAQGAWRSKGRCRCGDQSSGGTDVSWI